jgi:hypothetical protein
MYRRILRSYLVAQSSALKMVATGTPETLANFYQQSESTLLRTLEWISCASGVTSTIRQ